MSSGGGDSEVVARLLTRRRLLVRSGQAGGALLAAQLGLPGLWAVEARAGAGVTAAGAATTATVWTFGGELQYFRSDPQHLEQRLERCAQAGYTTIQAYVPWNVHENQRERLDFSGKTQPVIVNDHADEYQIETPDDEIAHGGAQARVIANTDLDGYLHMLAHHGFRVILRPGPFISDEWRNGGLPDWLLNEGDPGMYMCGPDGTPLTPGAPFDTPPGSILAGGGPLYYFPSPSYASDVYLGEARRWLAAFAAFVKPWLASAGGPVVAVQVDDETCFYYRFGPFEADYHPAMVARYRAQTGEAPPTAYPAPGGEPGALRAAFTWQDFKARQIGEYLGTLAADLRGAGVDVPIYHELELQLSPPAGLAATAAGVDVLHPEFYNGDSGPWSLPLNELCAAAVRAAQRNRKRVFAVEMQNSDPLLYTLLIGEGLSGGLQFTYTDGISETGYDQLALLGRTIHAAGERLVNTTRRVDTAIVWCPDQLYAPYQADRYGFERDIRRVAERDIPALATMLTRAGLAFDLLDTEVAEAPDYRAYRSIWLVAGDMLPRSAQQNLVAYVKSGGRLICWPAAPTLDERLEPCTLLADQLYPVRRLDFHPADVQEIRALGVTVPVFRGVQTYTLTSSAQPFAFLGEEVCGYRRRYGRGEAWLLGSWPAADSLPGRAGTILELQQVGSSNQASAVARSLARKHFGDAAAAAVPDALNASGAGSPQYVVVYYYSNDRRGGEVVTGGTVAYWDGAQAVPIVEFGTAQQPSTPAPQPYGATVSQPPFRPLTEAHLALAGSLHGRYPAARTSDLRAQVRVLSADGGKAATVTALNRYPDDVATVIETSVDGRRVRLPQRGQLKLPASASLLLPVSYELAAGARLEQATAQLLGFRAARASVELDLFSPAGGEAVVSVPGPLAAARLGGKPIAVSQAAGRSRAVLVRVELPPGEQTLALGWHPQRRRPRRRRRRVRGRHRPHA
jgi:beta-galactosidase